MAGHNKSLLQDPALMRYADVNANRHKYFRFTSRTAWIAFAYVIAFPSFMGFLAYTTDGKYDMRGKRRGDTIVEF
ncbi:hypothetical protein M501DRAFT_994450 [Patellaria atrata CBS 101060]|uniref:NADH-ubiquinone oxidoreductase B15 subunit n=1 Tax=Patellaria atrata CBS 101060 TaxID=1346257 RepID=A0A9P4VVX5_9PEZI|nr:hypothetical protein M501DRAFT_994450 [Patellaria atrata CBS 101060]